MSPQMRGETGADEATRTPRKSLEGPPLRTYRRGLPEMGSPRQGFQQKSMLCLRACRGIVKGEQAWGFCLGAQAPS